MKKYFSLILVIVIICSLVGCEYGYKYADLKLEGEYSRELEGTTLTVYNWGKYISDGADETIDVNREFEKLTGIKVNYMTFESNETMYSQVKNGGVNYDIVIPSDYMIERLKNEDMLKKIDVSSLSNYHYIDEQYKKLFFDENDEYSVP
ncbi:MAG: spermidine/putrescine ABC transporter substrate-binding protein, partial [Clostridia bacterium]|nr:spermidine/putrescine ABC transporter substrate-binding protein [Clostridia bacterium]